VRDNRENSARERSAEFGRANPKKAIMFWWPYLWHPPLDCADLWIYCSSHTPLLTYRWDLKEHNPFDRNHHRKFPRKQKEIHLQKTNRIVYVKNKIRYIKV
jgi:hypothetical protein